MEKKRFIFDLDNTLLTYDKNRQNEFFYSEFGENNPFKEDLNLYLETYWNSFPRLRNDTFASLLTLETGVKISPEFVKRWTNVIENMPPVLEDGVEETLEYLKGKKKSLGILTNGYRDCQIKRLQKAGIYEYFDDIYAGDFVLKPQKVAYKKATESYLPEECIFIGDSIENDYIAPREYGYDAVLYDKRERHPKGLVKIKRLTEVKKYGE